MQAGRNNGDFLCEDHFGILHANLVPKPAIGRSLDNGRYALMVGASPAYYVGARLRGDM